MEKARSRDIPTPFDLFRATVQPEWIDHNKHMNMGYYLVIFDLATDAFFDFVGINQRHRKKENVTTFSLEAHITYQREVRAKDPLRFTTRLIDFDTKRLHYIHEMYHAEQDYLSATNELMSLHVSNVTRRSEQMTEKILHRLKTIKIAHSILPASPGQNRLIGLNAKPTTSSTKNSF